MRATSRGRLRQRGEALAARFYYHSHIKRLRYDDCLLNLEKEFFITNLYISQRLTARTELIKKLVDKKANKRGLKKQYPHYDWNLKSF